MRWPLYDIECSNTVEGTTAFVASLTDPSKGQTFGMKSNLFSH